MSVYSISLDRLPLNAINKCIVSYYHMTGHFSLDFDHHASYISLSWV